MFFSLQIIKLSSDLIRSFHQNHLIVVADAALPGKTLVLRVCSDPWIDNSLEGLVLSFSVPIFLRADQEEGDLRLAYLGGCNAHTFALPEASGISKTIFAEINSVKHLLIIDWEVSDALHATLV